MAINGSAGWEQGLKQGEKDVADRAGRAQDRVRARMAANAGADQDPGEPLVCPQCRRSQPTGLYCPHCDVELVGESFVDVAAPGGHSNMGPTIYSTFWQNGAHTYNHAEGTSMAAPHVTGLAALLKDADANLTPDEIEQIITSTAADIGDAGRDDMFGAGRIDMAAALKAVQPEYPPASETTYIEAESGRLLTPMKVETDANTPSGAFALSSMAGEGTVELRFTLDRPQLVYVWGLTSAEQDGAGTYHVSVDSSVELQWDFPVSNDWAWNPITNAATGSPMELALDAGSHFVRFSASGGGARLDAIAVGGNEATTASYLASEYIQAVAQYTR